MPCRRHPRSADTVVAGGSNVTRFLERNQIDYYDLSISAACTNLLLTVTTITGDQNIYVDVTDYPAAPTGTRKDKNKKTATPQCSLFSAVLGALCLIGDFLGRTHREH